MAGHCGLSGSEAAPCAGHGLLLVGVDLVVDVPARAHVPARVLAMGTNGSGPRSAALFAERSAHARFRLGDGAHRRGGGGARQEGAVAKGLVGMRLDDLDKVRLAACLRRRDGAVSTRRRAQTAAVRPLAVEARIRAAQCSRGWEGGRRGRVRTRMDRVLRRHASRVRCSHVCRTAEPPTVRKRSCAAAVFAVGLYSSSRNSAPSSRSCRSCGTREEGNSHTKREP